MDFFFSLIFADFGDKFVTDGGQLFVFFDFGSEWLFQVAAFNFRLPQTGLQSRHLVLGLLSLSIDCLVGRIEEGKEIVTHNQGKQKKSGNKVYVLVQLEISGLSPVIVYRILSNERPPPNKHPFFYNCSL